MKAYNVSNWTLIICKKKRCFTKFRTFIWKYGKHSPHTRLNINNNKSLLNILNAGKKVDVISIRKLKVSVALQHDIWLHVGTYKILNSYLTNVI